MKVISCDGCGLLFDADKIKWPTNFETENGIDESKAAWSFETGEWVPFVECPCCKEPILSPL